MYFVLFYIHFLRDCSNQKRTQRLQEQPLRSVLEFGLDLFKGKALLLVSLMWLPHACCHQNPPSGPFLPYYWRRLTCNRGFRRSGRNFFLHHRNVVDIDGFDGAWRGILVFHCETFFGAVVCAGSTLHTVHSVNGPCTAFLVYDDCMSRASF